jgi:hypothetical protein
MVSALGFGGAIRVFSLVIVCVAIPSSSGNIAGAGMEIGDVERLITVTSVTNPVDHRYIRRWNFSAKLAGESKAVVMGSDSNPARKAMCEPLLVREWGADAFHKRVLELESLGYVTKLESYRITPEMHPETGEIVHLHTIEMFARALLSDPPDR